MSQTCVMVIEPDLNRRRIVSLMVRAGPAVDLAEFSSLNDALPSLNAKATRLIICPWSDGGEHLLHHRIAHPSPDAPHLLILTQDITRGRIAVCGHAGNAHLIHAAPLNLNALRNRILLLLEGPSTFADRLTRARGPLQAALATLPSLKKRLAF